MFYLFINVMGCDQPSEESQNEKNTSQDSAQLDQSDENQDSTDNEEITDNENPEESEDDNSENENTSTEPSEENTDTGSPPEIEQGPLEIIGYYVQDNDGSYHNITQNVWEINFGAGEIYTYQIRQYNNQQGWIIAENDDNDPLETGKWSRFDYRLNRAGNLTVCQSTSQADDMMEALNWPPSIPGQGCTGWGWLTLTLFENL